MDEAGHCLAMQAQIAGHRYWIVLLDSAGRVKITDFGLAKRLNVEASDIPSADTPVVESHTATGMVLGTPSYMPPEQAAANSQALH